MTTFTLNVHYRDSDGVRFDFYDGTEPFASVGPKESNMSLFLQNERACDQWIAAIQQAKEAFQGLRYKELSDSISYAGDSNGDGN